MRRNREVLIQAGQIALLNMFLTVLMLAVYWLIGQFSTFVLKSAVIGWFVSSLSFFALSVAVSSAADKVEAGAEPAKMARTVQASSTGRLLVLLGLYAVLFKFKAVDPISSLIPVVFTRISIVLIEFFRKDGVQTK